MRQREKMATAKKIEKLNNSIITTIELLMQFVEANKVAIDELTGKSSTVAKNAKVEKTVKKSKKTAKKGSK